MSKIKDLKGRRFGRLVVTGEHKRANSRTYWGCTCDCGAEKDVLSSLLIGGKTQSCGCLSTEARKKDKKPSIIGLRVGSLVVESKSSRTNYFLMRCDCGAEDEYFRGNITRSLVSCKSCIRYKVSTKGLRLGNLVGTGYHRRNGDVREILWKCDCGKEKYIPLSEVKRNTNPTRSCGCSRRGGVTAKSLRKKGSGRDSYLYVMRIHSHWEESCIKVGRSVNPDSRRNGIEWSTQGSHTVELLYTVPLHEVRVQELEEMLAGYYKKYKFNWFEHNSGTVSGHTELFVDGVQDEIISWIEANKIPLLPKEVNYA